MCLFKKQNSISALIKQKILQAGGKVEIPLFGGEPCLIQDIGKNCFISDKLPNHEIDYCVFDIIHHFLKQNGGKAKKGDGRKYKVGQEKCSRHTVIGIIAYDYYEKNDGESTFDPVFVLAALLEWAKIAKNCRGYIQLI